MYKVILKTLLFFTFINTSKELNLGPIQHSLPFLTIANNEKNICPAYLEKYTNFLNQEQGEFLVKKTAGLFPQMDTISHFVLHTNDVLINKVLNNEILSTTIKKNLVLSLIHMTQMGDSTGSHILQFYNDLVNCLL